MVAVLGLIAVVLVVVKRSQDDDDEKELFIVNTDRTKDTSHSDNDDPEAGIEMTDTSANV